MGYIAGIFVTGIICATIYGLFELFARRKERITIIEKLAEIKNLGQIGGEINFSFGSKKSFWSLRGACLFIGLGAGLMVGFSIGKDNFSGDVTAYEAQLVGIIYGGSLLMCGGLGLLVSFIVERILSKK